MQRRTQLGIAAAAILTLLIGARFAGPGWLARRLLADRGFLCDPLPLDVTLALDLGLRHAEVGASHCTVRDGPIASFDFDRASADLEGQTPTTVDVHGLALNPRVSATDSEAGGWAVALLANEVPARLREGFIALAQLSHRGDVPQVTLDQATLGRGGVLILRGLTLRASPDHLALQITSAGPPERRGRFSDIELDLRELSLEATPSRVSITGQMALRVELGLSPTDPAQEPMLALDQSVRFSVTGTGLDSEHPQYAMQREPSPLLDMVQERLPEIRARMASGATLRNTLRARLESRTQRIDDLARRLEERVGAAQPSAP